MTYQAAAGLQRGIYTSLQNNGTLYSRFDGNIFDAAPVGPVPDKFVLLGEETVTDRSSAGSVAARHDFSVSLNGREASYAELKKDAAAVCDALLGASFEIERGCIADIRLLTAKARRGPAKQYRQVLLTFRALIDDI